VFGDTSSRILIASSSASNFASDFARFTHILLIFNSLMKEESFGLVNPSDTAMSRRSQLRSSKNSISILRIGFFFGWMGVASMLCRSCSAAAILAWGPDGYSRYFITV
jgi:hypothetical protein